MQTTYYYLLSTGALYSTEEKLSFEYTGNSVNSEGTVDFGTHSMTAKNFSFNREHLVASWSDDTEVIIDN